MVHCKYFMWSRWLAWWQAATSFSPIKIQVCSFLFEQHLTVSYRCFLFWKYERAQLMRNFLISCTDVVRRNTQAGRLVCVHRFLCRNLKTSMTRAMATSKSKMNQSECSSLTIASVRKSVRMNIGSSYGCIACVLYIYTYTRLADVLVLKCFCPWFKKSKLGSWNGSKKSKRITDALGLFYIDGRVLVTKRRRADPLEFLVGEIVCQEVSVYWY